VLIALVLLGNVAVHDSTDLVAAAAASGRPPECAAAARTGARKGVWLRARVPNLRRYCNLMSRAQARLQNDVAGARVAAEAAQKLFPNRAAPKVVLARVALAGGDEAGALAAFDEALALDPRSVEHPLAMHDLARARAQSGKLDEALATYRVLVPRAALLPTRELRAEVLLEAAHMALAAAAKADDPTLALDEALAYLREAARDPHHRLATDVSLSLVLALDRAGNRPQADALLAEVGAAGAEWRLGGSYLAAKADGYLMAGLAHEVGQPAEAIAAYRAYLVEVSDGPNAETARARLARLAPSAAPKRRVR
jgi:tetratricopeptide (TPR) repeat protein